MSEQRDGARGVREHGSTEALAAALAAGEVGLLVDVRSPFEFSGGHVPGAVNVPLSRLGERLDELPDAVWVICRSGVRSSRAAMQIRASGRVAINVTGGMLAWTGPVEPPSSMRSLLLPLAASLTLGLAPLTPEPHLLGKLRWVAGGGVGMGPLDAMDLALHGAPWVWLVVATLGVLRARRRASGGPPASSSPA